MNTSALNVNEVGTYKLNTEDLPLSSDRIINHTNHSEKSQKRQNKKRGKKKVNLDVTNFR